MKKNHSLLLFSKDIKLLTGKSIKSAQRLITEIWAGKNKPKQRWITITDFARYHELTEEIVSQRLTILYASLE